MLDNYHFIRCFYFLFHGLALRTTMFKKEVTSNLYQVYQKWHSKVKWTMDILTDSAHILSNTFTWLQWEKNKIKSYTCFKYEIWYDIQNGTKIRISVDEMDFFHTDKHELQNRSYIQGKARVRLTFSPKFPAYRSVML